MKIIKEGRIEATKKIKRFVCSKCGCVFDADNTEYKFQHCPRNEHSYMIDCPFCNVEVHINC